MPVLLVVALAICQQELQKHRSALLGELNKEFEPIFYVPPHLHLLVFELQLKHPLLLLPLLHLLVLLLLRLAFLVLVRG